MRKVRTLRHWKQQYEKDARFIWRRPCVFAGVSYNPGDPIPDLLFKNKTKLRRFWESKHIELAEVGDSRWDHLELELPDGVAIPDDLNITEGNGSWYGVTVHGGEGEAKLNGKKSLVEFIVKLVATRAEEAKAEEEAAEAAAQAVAELIASAAEYEIEITAEQVESWTEDQRAEVELYLEALPDEDPDDPEQVPEVLPQPPTAAEIEEQEAIDAFIAEAAEVNIEVTAELAASLDEDQWDLSLQYFALLSQNPEADLEHPTWLPEPAPDGS